MTMFSRCGAMLLVVTPVPLIAQEAPADPMATAPGSQAQTSASGAATVTRQGATEVAEATPCKPKKKKGFGLGSILKAASKTGLTNMVGGGLIGGYGGAVAGTAINTGVSVAESSKTTAPADAC
ncbi:hypothetical protein ABS767_13290 [Sphingomonas sp. ST-64]|uniref:Uncharacterized protein n=1 Tax=Sphingomonas plantiphila TaxID=3163295 RepID=A0ABW8YP86_9SPHN